MPDPQSILAPLKVPDAVKAEAWDTFHGAKSPEEFRSRLDKLPLTPETKASLWDAKMQTGGGAPQPKTWADHIVSQFFPGGIDERRIEAARALVDAAEGAFSGAASTMFQGGDLIRRGLGMERVIQNPDAQQMMRTPDSTAGKVGRLAEQTAELAIPMGEVNVATKALGAVPRIATRAAASGAIAGVQSGGDPYATAMGAAPVAVLEGTAAALRAPAVWALEKGLSSMPRQLSERAIALAEKYGIPLTQGMKGGSKTVQAVEKTLGHSVAPDLYEPILEAGQKGMSKGATDLSSGFSTDAFAAGDAAVGRLRGRALQLDAASRGAYDDLAAFTEQDAKTAGTDVVSREKGLPVEAERYPVDLTGFQRKLAPLYNFIREELPALQRDSDPSLVYLRGLMESGPKMNAAQVEEYLSKFKELSRGSKIPELRDKAQGLAARAIAELQPEIDRAVSVNPDALLALQFARKTWRERSRVFDLIDSLSGDVTGKTGQVTAAQRLLRPADASYPMIQDVLEVAPEAAEDLGKAYMAKVFKKAEGGEFTSPKEAQNLWNQIGKRTKAALYTPEHIEDVNAFLELARRVNENPNPSGTGIVSALLKLGILVTNPLHGGAALALGRKAAQLLYNPEGAAALREALQAQGATVPTETMTVLKSLLAAPGTKATPAQ